MNTNHKITIPKPCNEDWDKMTPNDSGRFCGSCSKNVIDFTTMLPDEIQVYFQQHSNVCGRIKQSQLDSIIIQIPNITINSKTDRNLIFLLVLFLVMGTTLFSCKDQDGSKYSINKIEIIKDSTIPKKNKTKKRINKKAEFIAANIAKTEIATEVGYGTGNPYDYGIAGGIGLEPMFNMLPEFPGGLHKFENFVKKNFVIPKKAKHLDGIIDATFIIMKDGTLDSINISNDICYGINEELIRVLSQSEKWKPGFENNKPTKLKYQISVVFKPDSIKKTFFGTKMISKIDTISIKPIPIFKD
ncbi:hypothetical protein FNW52_00375 [Flavobacterium sp. ZT3R18]|uniref:hypothetical protein n=1 Tax=Flavobacterium sp. ZT3R18 TaxID=2594429 RepID=UPI00117B0E6C|nr:hypothetical protein [Flavobacterium sp. ZT3R18]TRX38539.1 hypothetical protein FNW52_00375 [Flavobacterium sp. ZT3R18]